LAWAFAAVTVILSSGCGEEKKTEAAAPPPPEVEVVKVVEQDVPITKEWVAVLKGSVDAEIRSQVSGYLLRQAYTNGDYVRKGDVLFEVDPRPFQEQVKQAQGNLESAKAAVDQARASFEEARANQVRAEAALGKTENDVTRYTPLAKSRAIPQQDLDNALQANKAAKAEVEAAKAAVSTAQAVIGAKEANVTAANASVQTAQLNLGFTKVTSLIDGIAGIANAQVGNFVAPQTQNPLTIVSNVDPILAQFAPSEQEYLRATSINGGAGKAIDAIRRLSFELVLADGSVYAQKGHLQYIDREVDPRTGSINIQVAFPNPERLLRPGGYGNIKSVVRTEKNALAIPQRSVTEIQGRNMVAVVGSDKKVAIKTVKTGEKIGSMWIIQDGLAAGDQVVAEGIQKVRDGMVVNPKPYAKASS
jgi:membrane fusion protein (multidrug efflux system)